MSNRTWKRDRRPARRPVSRRDRLVGSLILGGVGLGVAAVIGVGLATNGQGTHPGGSSSGTQPLTARQKQAAAWKAAVANDFGPLASVLQPLLTDEKSWMSGSGSAATVVADIQHFLPDFQLTDHDLARQAPLALAPGALTGYRMAYSLYYESTAVESQAAALPSGPLLHQIQLSSVRLRDLGDRLFDEAGAEVDKVGPPAQTVPGVTVVPPADVPLWTSVGLAAGPPLAPQPATTPPVSYQRTRPQEPFRSWSAQVAAAGIPSAADEAAAIRSGSLSELGAMSSRLQEAVNRLTAEPDPTGARTEGTRLRLDLLVDAEATRLAEAADLCDGPTQAAQLRQSAQAVAVIGDRLWDGRLGTRSTDFPDSLLTTGAGTGA